MQRSVIRKIQNTAYFRDKSYAMLTVEEMKAVDIRTVDRDTLVDIRDGLLYWDYNDSIKASNKILV